MRQDEALARTRELEMAELDGALIRRDAVEAAAGDAVGVVLLALEALPDALAPGLVGIDDHHRIRATLKDAFDDLAAELAQAFERLAQGQAAPQDA